MSRLQRSDELEDEMRRLIPSVDKLGQMLGDVDYLADEGLATSAYLALRLPQPLLLEGEVDILRRRVKGASATLVVQVADAVSRMRESDIQKPPGIAEAIDWVAALDVLGVEQLDAAAVERTLGAVLKYGED